MAWHFKVSDLPAGEDISPHISPAKGTGALRTQNTTPNDSRLGAWR